MAVDLERLDDLLIEQGRSRRFAAAMKERRRRQLRSSFQQPDGAGLMNFIRHFWHVLEPMRPFVEGWALRAMCRHLDAVSKGYIRRLLINVPPGSMKSLLVNVFWPAWEWSAMNRPDLRYISFSYASHLTWRDNQRFSMLLADPDFRDLYAKQIDLVDDSKIKVSNTRTGWKFATSVGGVGTGERGDRVILDDPHNVREAESDTVRHGTVTWFKEAMSNRLNDMTRSVIIVIMQRVHEDDVSGAIITDGLGYTHLNIPMEFESDRACTTFLTIDGRRRPFWKDPRNSDGQCFWPERFDEAAVVECKLLGEHAFAGQYQQRPEPRGGGLFKRDYWRRHTMPNNKFPKLHYICASLDGAFTEKEENDPCGFTCWGVFVNEAGDQCAITLNAWRKHLPLHKNVRERRKDESWEAYKIETQQDWGLIQWLNYECNRWGIVNKLLIENKANGHDVANELIRLFSWAKFAVELVDPGLNDKFARGMRIQPVFAEGLVYTLPEVYKKRWVDDLIADCAKFPRGKYDDQVDSMTQAIWWLRKAGFLVMNFERKAAMVQQEKYRRAAMPLYPV